MRACASIWKSNDLRNWIKPKRKLRNRASPPYGRDSLLGDVSAGAHTHWVPTKSVIEGISRVLRSSSSMSLPSPLSLAFLSLSPSPLFSLYPLLSTTDRLSIRMGNQGFRFAFGACPLTERVSHSIRNNALSTEALFRNDSCHPLYFNRARDYYFSSSKFFLAKFSVSLQFARKLHFPHPKPRNLKKSLSAPRYFISCTVEG